MSVQALELRKIEPNRRALEGKTAWVSGLRRDQSEGRADTPILFLTAVQDVDEKIRALEAGAVDYITTNKPAVVIIANAYGDTMKKIDETGDFPEDVLAALTAADLHAIHVPEEYGGQGGDALAACLVIEEVARASAACSLIPAVNKLGSMPLLVGGSDELKQTYLPPLARGEGMFSYALSEPEAGSDAGGMRTTAVRDGDDWVLNGSKRWITNAGVSEWYTVMAVTDAEKRTRGAHLLRGDHSCSLMYHTSEMSYDSQSCCCIYRSCHSRHWHDRAVYPPLGITRCRKSITALLNSSFLSPATICPAPRMSATSSLGMRR